MAIVVEQIEINGRMFNHTYSDSNRYIVGGSPSGEYEDAYDPTEFNRTYTEGALIVSEEFDFAEAGKILLGVIE